MAKKITRLGDPANPYGKKKTPTGRAVDKPVPRTAPVTPRKAAPIDAPKGKGLIKDLNEKYGGGARKRAIDAAIAGRKA